MIYSSFSQTTEPISHFSQGRIQRIDSVVNDAIDNDEIPGAVVLVNHNGKDIYHKNFGYADIGTKKKMELSSIFRIASMTKAITAVGVMVLYERGHFLLNDPISRYIPEFKNPQVLVESDSLGNILETKPANKEIRIIDLLTHTSGLSYKFTPNKLQMVYERNGIIDGFTENKIMLSEQMKKLSELPLLFEPGTRYQYGLSIDLLGYLCEVISKKPLDKFLEDEIFKPLKMTDTQFYLSEEKKDRLVTLYSWVDGRLSKSQGDESPIKVDNVLFPTEGAKTYFSGGGGLTSTVSDYSRFTQMILNQGELDGVRLISRKTVEFITKPKIDTDYDDIPDISIGGFRVFHDIVKLGELIGSEGAYIGGGAFYGSYLIDPKENLSIVFMSQVMPARTKISERVAVMVYQTIK